MAGATTRDGGLRHLPEPGAMLDQGAWLMDALDALSQMVYRKNDAS